MNIFPLGESCFKLKGNAATVVVDPYIKTSSGKLMAKVEADIVTFSSKENGDIGRVTGSPFIIRGAGEYEVKGVSVWGFPLEGKTGYLYEIDGLKICYLNALTDKLAEKQIEMMGDVDILIVLGDKKMISLIEQLEPKILIPINPSKEFLKEIGGENVEPLNKFSLLPFNLPEEREIIWLKK